MHLLKHPKVKAIKPWILSHKLQSALILLGALLVIYLVHKHFSTTGETRYVLTTARIGDIESTVSGTGYVSSENQIEVKSKVSGDIIKVLVHPGDVVTQGQLLAEVDARDTLVALKTQQIAYAKLTQPAKPEDIQVATDNVTKAGSDAWSAISDASLVIPDMISGLKTIIYGQTGYLNDQSMQSLGTVPADYRNTAGVSYDKMNLLYEANTSQYKTLSRLSSPTEIKKLLQQTYEMMRQAADTLKYVRNAISYVSQNYPNYNPSGLSSASTNVTTWSNNANSSISNLLSAQNSIASSNKALSDLQNGADVLDVQSAALSLEAKQNAYNDYFIRAPYAGVVAKVNVSVGSSASGAVVATIVSTKKFADIPLNEIDAANVKPGDRVRVSFDAASGLVVTGTVEEADLIGTVSQGVVTYNVRVAFDADTRVKPGMSTSADIITDEKSEVLLVPAGAVKTRGQTQYVEVFALPLSGTKQELMAGIPSQTPPIQHVVETGLSNDTETEIISGLNAGDQVVVRTIAGAITPTTTSAPTLFGGGGAQNGNVRLNAGGVRRQ